MRMWVRFLDLLSELRIQCCRKLQCRSQRWLGSGVAVAGASASSFSSDSTRSLETTDVALKKKKNNVERPQQSLLVKHNNSIL